MTKTYRVECEWDKTGWWVVTIPEVPGAITQCRRLDRVADDVSEVLELLTTKKPGTYKLDIHAEAPGRAGKLAAEARALRAEAATLSEKAAKTISSAVVSLSTAGFSLRDIGQLVGVSHQRVEQLLKAKGVSPKYQPRKRAKATV